VMTLNVAGALPEFSSNPHVARERRSPVPNRLPRRG
jgi:hypothetical protein